VLQLFLLVKDQRVETLSSQHLLLRDWQLVSTQGRQQKLNNNKKKQSLIKYQYTI